MIKKIFYILPTVLLMAGCVTDEIANKQDVRLVRTQVNEQVIQLEDRINALTGQVDGLERNIENLQQKMGSLENSVSNKMFNYQKEVKEMQNELKSTKKSLSDDFERKMNIVIEEVINENKKIAEKINVLQKDKYDLGVYHTVDRGETLSHIASKYGISVDDIISSNELENPDRLKVGQKLFIPQN